MAPRPTRPQYRLVVFDFDGTLCDSADIKTDAFYELYVDEHGADFATRVRGYHLENAGLSRYDKIRYVEHELIGVPPSDERVTEVADKFSRLVEDAVSAAPLFDGVIEYLSAAADGFRHAIASATPTAELRRIAERKNIAGFFDAIEGSPRSKGEILVGFTARYGIDPSQMVMVGDQPSDARSAREAGADALLIAPAAEWTAPLTRVGTFLEAASWLRERTGTGTSA